MELATCEIPWGGEQTYRIFMLVVQGDRPAVPAAGQLPGGAFPGYPRYEALIRRCWAQEPAERPASFGEVLAELRALQGGS